MFLWGKTGKRMKWEKGDVFEKDIQSMIPRNPVDSLVSSNVILSLVPLRIVALEFMPPQS